MTQDQEKEVKRVCGENYEPSDVPALWRREAEKSEADQREADDLRQREDYIKDKYTPDLEEIENKMVCSLRGLNLKRLSG